MVEWIRGIGLRQSKIRGKVFSVCLAAKILTQNRGVLLGTGDDLKPEVAHLVERFRTPRDALGRPPRVTHVGGRVIVCISHRDPCAFWKGDRLARAIAILSTEIPIQ